ncbi:hypothetical protein JTB14_034300 [Gonioctena quinquepunctata]|nr:hypothetical protein JTB14_034300 [Gonioctena quinquepunctata]
MCVISPGIGTAVVSLKKDGNKCSDKKNEANNKNGALFAADLGVNVEGDNRYIDSGASSHMTGNEELSSSLSNKNLGQEIVEECQIEEEPMASATNVNGFYKLDVLLEQANTANKSSSQMLWHKRIVGVVVVFIEDEFNMEEGPKIDIQPAVSILTELSEVSSNKSNENGPVYSGDDSEVQAVAEGEVEYEGLEVSSASSADENGSVKNSDRQVVKENVGECRRYPKCNLCKPNM